MVNKDKAHNTSVSSLINATLSQNVPFTHRNSYSASIMVLLLNPILSSKPRIGDDLWLAHNGFSALHKYH